MALFPQGLVNGLEMGSLYALVAVGLCLILGVMKTVNFAHGELLMLGAYATFYICAVAGIPYPLSFILAVAILFGFGFGLEKVAFRPVRENMLAGFILTLGLSMFLMNLGYRVFGTKTRALPTFFPGMIHLGNVHTSVERVATAIIALALIAVFAYLLYRTKLGRTFRAVAQDSEAAQLQGINIGHTSSLSLAFSAALAASAGALIATVFQVGPAMGMRYAAIAFVVVVVGGLGSVPGAILGGLLIGLVEGFTCIYLSTSWAIGATFLTAFLVIAFRPQGLMGSA